MRVSAAGAAALGRGGSGAWGGGARGSPWGEPDGPLARLLKNCVSTARSAVPRSQPLLPHLPPANSGSAFQRWLPILAPAALEASASCS